MRQQAAAVDFQALAEAFEHVSAGQPSENEAHICLDTGRIFFRSESAGVQDDDFPEDLDASGRYVAVPHKHDLNLGRQLVQDFVYAEMPEQAGAVRDLFRRRGAYARFKGFLDARGMLQRWYDFEERATEAALRDWCRTNGIPVVDARPRDAAGQG